MNKTYKVIYNRTRCMYQVVSELAKGHTKSETPEMLKSLFSKHSGLTRGIVMAVLSMSLAMPVGVAVQATDTTGTGETTTSTSDTTTSNTSDTTTTDTAVTVKDGATLVGSGAVSVSSSTDTTKNTTTITIAVPTDGKVEANNTGLVTGGTVYTAVNAEQTDRETAVKSVTDKIGTLDANGNYIQKDASVSSNLSILDTQVKTNADAISKETTDREAAVTSVTNSVSSLSDSAVKYDTDLNKTKVTLAGEGGTTITNVKDGALTGSSTDAVTGKQLYAEQTARETAIGTLNANGNYIQKDASVFSNLSTLDTQVKTNADAISTETAKRTTAINALETKLTSGGTNSLATKANVNASNIGKNIDTSSETTDEAKTKKQKENAALWGEALGLGAIENGDSMLISGGTLYSELRPSADGTYSYISKANTTAVNLIHLDAALNALGVEMLVDSNGNPVQYTSALYKYFKVDPETTTNDDGTKTYATDAEANGTNSVAIGPNAKTAMYTTTVTSGDSTTTTETAADHAVAIGDGATVNAAGDQGVALGNGAVTGEAETTTSDGTTTTTTDAKGGESSVAIGDTAKANGNQALAFGKGASVLNPSGTAVSTGSTAIGSGAKVDGGDNSIALGTSATVNKVSDAMALGNGATINKTATGSIAIGKAAVTGGVDKTIKLTNGTDGTLAAAGGENSIAIGNGSVSEGNEALALGNGAKVTNGATGGDSAAAIVKTGSAAIGDEANVYNSATSMAIGNGASISEGENTTVIGSGAKATQTKQAFVAGYQASSDSSAESSVAIGDNASTHSVRTTAIGYKAEAHNADSIAIGSEAKTDDNGGGIAIGTSASVAYGGLAFGEKAEAKNDDSLAIGNGAVADVNKSISIGYNAGVGTAEDNKEKNGSLVAIGTSAGNNVKGMQNVAIGASAGSSVLSSNNIAIGTNAGYGIKNVTSATDTNPQNGYNISIGAGANYTEGNTNQNILSSIAIGHNTHAVNYAVALGEGASATTNAGMALGYNAKSYGTDEGTGAGSIAIGNNASASNGNVALGAGSVATGTPTTAALWTGQAAPKYYISVGGKASGSTDDPMLRRISNVADGADAHDVVTVAQLQKVSDQLKNTITGTGSDGTDVKTYSTTYIDDQVKELKNDIQTAKTKYFSVNSGSQSANSGGTGADGNYADAMAIGPNAKSSNIKALAIGNNVSASGTLSIAIGTANNPSTDTTTADNPHPTSSEGTSSVAIGTSAIAQTDNSIAIGTRATTYTANTTSSPVTKVGIQSIAIGYGAETRDNNAIAFGTGAKANSAASIAIGENAQALNENAVVVGTSSTAYGSDSVTLGKGNTNNGKGVMTTGNSNSVTNSQSAADVVQNSGIYGSSNEIKSVSSSNSSNAITDVYAVGNSNTLNQNGEKNVLSDVSLLGNNNTIENGTAGAYTQTVKQIAIVGSGNTVKGNTQVDYDTWGTVQRDTILGYNNTVDATNQSTPVSNLQILGNDVTATLGNSVYLGTGSSATASKSATTEAIELAKEQGDAEALASDEYKNATTEAEQIVIKQKYEAKYIHAANIAAMDKDGISAGIINYDKDYTYGNDSAYTYAGSNPTGVVTVGSKEATRRIQNVSAGLVGPNSTDAVNGSQLYALTRQIRFGGDNSTFGDVATSDINVVAKGSNEKLAITGGAEGVSVTTTTDGKSVITVDGTKITDKNIAVIAENDALHVKLASNLKNLNTASMGKTTTGTATDGNTTTSYQETLKLDGTGDNGGTLTLKDATGANGVTLRTSGTTTTADVTGTKTNRLHVNDTTVATTDDGLKFGGDTGADSALKLNNKLTVKGGADTSKLTENNIGVVSDGSGTLTVKLNKNVNLGTDGSLTTGAVTATTVTADTVTSGNSTLNTNGLTITNGPSVLATGINAGSKKITNVSDGEANADAANYGQVKAAKTILTQGNNTQLSSTNADDGHQIYTVNVDNLSYKAGTDTTARSVTLSNGLTFQNGKNTTAVAGDNGTITYNLKDKIELGAETDSNNHIVVDGTQGLLTLGMDAAINGNAGTASIGGVSIGKSGSNQVITGLTNKTWTVGTTQAVDGRAATENQLQSVADNLNTANTNIATLQHGFKVQANGDTTTESTVKADDALNFTAGDNAEVTTTKGSKQITISVDNLSVKDNNGTAQSVKLADGLNFQDGTNTTAVVGANGSVTYDLKSSITLGTSTDEANRIIVNGTNGTITVGNLATINGNAGTASIGGVSIGKSGNDQTVTGLSNRTWVVGESTAVNGRAATENQLQSVSNAAHTNANNITTLQQGFTVTANNDNDKKSTIKAGDKLNFQAGKNVQVSTTADSKSIEVALSDTPEFTTVTAKDANGNITTVSGTGVTITPTGTGTQSVSLTSEGLDNGNHVIKNVASGGTVRTNAANIGDLQDAISNASTTTTNTGFNVKGDDTAVKKVKLGKQLNVVGGTTDSTQLSTGNIGVETTADAEGNATLTVKLKKDIALDSVTTGSTTMNTTGISNGDMSLTNTGMIIKNNDVSKQVSITTSGVSMGSQQVKNVADGTDTKDAVNKGQLDVVQTQVTNGWQIAGSNGQKVADIGAGKKVTFGDTTYATASVQPDGTDGAKVTYTINTAALTADTATGKITEPTTDGVATAQNVAQAINNAAWKIKANDNEATAIKAGTTVGLKAGNNLTLSQSGTDFTYKLNDTLTGIKSLTTAAQDGVTTTLAASGVTIASSDTGNKSVSLTVNGLNNGGKQITDVASGGDTDTNAANISDVKRLVQASASGTTETGFKVKGDDTTSQTVKLGKQLNVVGGVNDSSKLSNGNIGVVTAADGDGNATLTVKLNKDITLDSVKTGNTTLNTSGVTNGNMSLTGTGMTITDTDASKQISVTTSGVSMGSQRIQNVADATSDTDAATLKQVKNARTVVAQGDNVKKVTSSEATDGSHQMTYTVNVDNLSVKANKEAAKSVTLKNGLTFNNGTNTTATVGDNGEVKYDLNPTLTGLTSVIAGNSTLDTNGLTIKEGTASKVVITSDNVTMGGNVIHNVGAGQVGTDAVNKDQLDALQTQVNGGWNLVGKNSDGTAVTAKIGAGKKVTYVDGNYTKSVVTKDDSTGNATDATVKVDVTTGTFGSDAGKATATADGLATTQDVANAINSASWTIQDGNNPGNAQQVKAGDTVSFKAGDNLSLDQNGTNFTYALNSNLTGMNTITFTGLGNGASNLTIGLQNGGGANPDKGYYITGLSNTKWDQSNYEGSRAATEAQLREAIDKVSAATGTGGFGLTADEGANNGGEKKVSQTLGRTIAIQGDGTYDAEGKVVKQGNITTVAYTDNAGPTGAIKVKLNKDIDLSEAGSLTIGASKVSAGSIVLDNTSDAVKKIALNSTTGTAAIGGVTVNGAEKTVNGLSNTTWNGTAVSGRAATENQLVDAINEVKTQAANSELHIKKGVYAIGKDSQGQDITDTKGKNSVSIDVVNANGTVDGQVVINDVAKASELGTVGDLADNLKNPAGGSTTVVQAVNKVNQKVDDSLKQVNGDISNAVTEARKHTEVKSVDSDNNVTIDGTTTNADGGTVYKLGLNKDHLNLGNVHVYGNEGRVTAKTVESETVKIDDQTKLDKTGLTTGNTTVANNRIVVGDNGIKIEANGGQQTISGLTNTDWTGTAVHGRAATEDQLAKAISSATTTAAQNEQHIKAGTYDIQTTTDAKGNKQNKVTMKIVDGNGTDKGTVTINDVAKASDVGDTDKLAADIKNQNGGQPQTTSVVEAVNNLNEKVNNRVGDNKYSAITSTDPVQDGDSSTTAIGKLNNRMNDIYNTTTQHTTISNPDNNLDIKDTTGKKDYTINLKHQISLGDVKIDGDKGSIEAKSMKADTFTSGSTVVSNSGVAVGGKTYVSSDGLNANSQKITNVQAGVADTDAVNKKQLDDAKSEVTSGYQAADAKLYDAIQQTDAGLNEVGRAVNKLGNRLNRVGAGAAALAALHPGTYDPNDKWDFSAGVGHYHDANAVAIGAYYHPNDTTILSIGGSMGGGENMVNAGITWKMGRSSHEQAAQPVVIRKVQAAPVVQPVAPVRPAPVVTPAPVTTPAPVKSVASTTPVYVVPAVTMPMTQATTGDTAALAQILARQTAILEKLAQNQSQAAPSAAVAHGDDIFPDVPDNHWAYAYVAKLEKAGALKGFKRPAVLKSPMMTRDDFASVLYTAMANGATTNPALNGDDSLNRLAQEFKAELKNVKV